MDFHRVFFLLRVRFFSSSEEQEQEQGNLVKSRAHKSVAAGMEILLWVAQKIPDM